MARVINFEGRHIIVPDDATDDEIRHIIDQGTAPDLGNKPPPSDSFAPASSDPNGPFKHAPVEQTQLDSPLVRALKISAQGAGSGLANAVGFLPDLASTLLNFPLDVGPKLLNAPIAAADWGLKAAGGQGIPFRVPDVPPNARWPVGMGDAISNTVGGAADAFGFNRIPQSGMTPREQTVYKMDQFGTEMGSIGSGLAELALKRGPELLAGGSSKFYDKFVLPYLQSPGKTVIGDVGGGAGAGAALDVAEKNKTGNPLADALIATAATMGGGAAGMTGAGMVRAPKQALDSFMGLLPERGVRPDPNTLLPTSRRVMEEAARRVQAGATDPQAAASTLSEQVAGARAAGAPPPTSGLGSNDIGLVASERGARLRDPVPFMERDQAVKGFAQEKVTSLKDPGADQSTVAPAIEAERVRLAAERDATALPLLKQAEASGAVVNPQPVADLIDSMLAADKRPAVVSALTQARAMLNKAGTKELDTSVSGLYETRKAIRDVLAGRTETPTGRYAKKELVTVLNALDAEINRVAPEFGKYLEKYKEGSVPMDVVRENTTAQKLLEATNGEPANVAKRILTGDAYGSEKELQHINAMLFRDPVAQRGWRAAVADVLMNKVTATTRASTAGPEGPVSFAQLDKVFKQHEDALAAVMGPEKMSVLRQAHAALKPFTNLENTASIGSPTVENASLLGGTAGKALGTALMFKYGAVHSGMMMFRLKQALALTPGLKNMTMEHKIARVMDRMWFDPDLAEHLLLRPVKEVQGPAWNAKLNEILAAIQYGQDEAQQKQEKQ
jgi:hypothetical protein